MDLSSLMNWRQKLMATAIEFPSTLIYTFIWHNSKIGHHTATHNVNFITAKIAFKDDNILATHIYSIILRNAAEPSL